MPKLEHLGAKPTPGPSSYMGKDTSKEWSGSLKALSADKDAAGVKAYKALQASKPPKGVVRTDTGLTYGSNDASAKLARKAGRQVERLYKRTNGALSDQDMDKIVNRINGVN